MVSERKEASKYDIFEDRALSLLARWRKFHDSKVNNPEEVSQMCIKGFLQEINDAYTRELLKEDE